jgi:hypothetical protein
MPQQLASNVSRKWTIRMIVISTVLIAFGLWGLWDAVRVYPARGALAAEWLEFQYLEEFSRSRPPLDARAGVGDPAAEREKLSRMMQEKGQLPPVDEAAVRWLDALKLIGKTDGPRATAIPREDFRGGEGSTVSDARTRLDFLRAKFTTASGERVTAPSPLSPWDIPVQWLIMALGVGIGGYVALLIFRVKSRVFRFDPESRTLTLPGGATISPADIEDLDKRKWHKFYVLLVLKKDHPTLAGQAIELDLLRYEPVEAWVLEMEKAAFPDRAAQDPGASALPANPAPPDSQ